MKGNPARCRTISPSQDASDGERTRSHSLFRNRSHQKPILKLVQDDKKQVEDDKKLVQEDKKHVQDDKRNTNYKSAIN